MRDSTDIANAIEQVNGIVAAQNAALQSVKTALEGKAAGGGTDETWEMLCDVTLAEAVSTYTQIFAEPMKKLRVIIDTLAADADTNYSGFSVRFNGATQNSYKPGLSAIYPLAIPRKNAGRAVYDISAYYQGGTPMCEIHTLFQIGSNSEYNGAKSFVYDSITDPYVHDMMLPQIIEFSQRTYATFAAGTRYRIWGVKA